MKINKILDKISKKMHKKTGYSIIDAVLECEDNRSTHRFFQFNSDEWQLFIMFLEEASNN